MIYTYEQIITLNSPYEQLVKAGVLAENAKVLDALNDVEKTRIATQIIKDCPLKKLHRFALEIQVLRNFTGQQGAFYPVIEAAYQARSCIEGLLDPRNKKPYNLFLPPNFDHQLFHRFSELAQETIRGKEFAIAEKLALSTPRANRSSLAYNIQIAFPKSELAKQTNIAFTLCHNINSYLLAGKPEQFFNFYKKPADLPCILLYANLANILLTGHEERIGSRLAAIESLETRNNILTQLLLFSEVNSFKLIADAMNSQKHAANFHTLFARLLKTPTDDKRTPLLENTFEMPLP